MQRQSLPGCSWVFFLSSCLLAEPLDSLTPDLRANQQVLQDRAKISLFFSYHLPSQRPRSGTAYRGRTFDSMLKVIVTEIIQNPSG